MPDRQITWRDRLRYRFENTLSKGTIAIIGWLALLSIAIVALASLILAAMRVGQDPADHEHPYGFFEGAWQAMLRTLDPGVVAGDSAGSCGCSCCWSPSAASSSSASSSARSPRAWSRGSRSCARAARASSSSSFTLILGWSSKVYSIIGELLIANSNQKDPCIVILSERDKIEMEDDIRAKFPEHGQHAGDLPQRQSARPRRSRGR